MRPLRHVRTCVAVLAIAASPAAGAMRARAQDTDADQPRGGNDQSTSPYWDTEVPRGPESQSTAPPPLFAPPPEPPRRTLPIPLAQRPLTIPAGTLDMHLVLGYAHEPPLRSAVFVEPLEPDVSMYIGGRLGITDDLEVEADIIPLRLSPEIDWNSALLGATYRFIEDPLELGARVAWHFPSTAKQGAPLALEFGLPLAGSVGRGGRLETGLYYTVSFSEHVDSSLALPLIYTRQIGDRFAFGLRTGIGVRGSDADGISIPAWLFASYTAATSGTKPVFDIVFSGGFPLLFTPGADETVNSSPWEISVGGRVFFEVFGGAEAAADEEEETPPPATVHRTTTAPSPPASSSPGVESTGETQTMGGAEAGAEIGVEGGAGATVGAEGGASRRASSARARRQRAARRGRGAGAGAQPEGAEAQGARGEGAESAEREGAAPATPAARARAGRGSRGRGARRADAGP